MNQFPVEDEKASVLERWLTSLPELKLDHLFRMSDSTGIFQHARFTVPNFVEGYCTDDNARALVLALMLKRMGHDSRPMDARAAAYASFLTELTGDDALS